MRIAKRTIDCYFYFAFLDVGGLLIKNLELDHIIYLFNRIIFIFCFIVERLIMIGLACSLGLSLEFMRPCHVPKSRCGFGA